MTQAEATDPVRRKIRSTSESSAGPVDDRLARIWRQTVARAFKAAVGMNAQVSDLAVVAVPPDDLADLPDDGDMTVLLENGDGDVGLALVDSGLLAALVEMQTMGRVTERPAVRRQPTAVDGALVGPSLDRLLAMAGKGLAEGGQRDPATDYRFAMLTEAGAPPTLALADLLHKCLTLELRIDGGVRTGRLRFVIPDTGATEEQKASGRADWSQKIAQAVLGSDLVLDARLGQIRMPADQLMRLAVGDVLPFAREDLRRVRLVAGRDDTVARARLGQSAGFRAVKVVSQNGEEGETPWSQPGAAPDG